MKNKVLYILSLLGIFLLLTGCQKVPNEPIDVVIVGNEVEEGEQKPDITKWEYLELNIYCTYEDNDRQECWMWENLDKKYPDRISILNEYGIQGWEVIGIEPDSQYNIYYWLKRPIAY